MYNGVQSWWKELNNWEQTECRHYLSKEGIQGDCQNVAPSSERYRGKKRILDHLDPKYNDELEKWSIEASSTGTSTIADIVAATEPKLETDPVFLEELGQNLVKAAEKLKAIEADIDSGRRPPANLEDGSALDFSQYDLAIQLEAQQMQAQPAAVELGLLQADENSVIRVASLADFARLDSSYKFNGMPYEEIYRNMTPEEPITTTA